MRVGKGDASTNPADFFFPEDIDDGSGFRVPVEGAPIRVTAVRDKQGVEVDIEYDELPAEAEIICFACTYFSGGGEQRGKTIPAGEKGKMTIEYVAKLKVDSVRLRATMPGANLVWWSDVLRP